MRIKMLTTVKPGLVFLIAKPGTVLSAGREYKAMANQHGAISGLCDNGEWLGVKPGEFELLDAPEWVREIWEGLQNKTPADEF